MDYKKAYKEALERAKAVYQGKYKPEVAATLAETLQNIFPELKESDEKQDESVRKELLEHCKKLAEMYNTLLTVEEYNKKQSWIAWLEKQDKQMIAKGERMNVALSIINYLDNNRVEGCMDLSSMECEDIEDACVNSKWTKLYNYMKKKLERQDNTDKASY